MTGTPASPRPNRWSRRAGPAWALASFAVILAGGLLMYVVFSGDDEPLAGPMTTTVTTSVSSPTPLDQDDYEPIMPGTYFVDPDGDPATPLGATVVIDRHGWIGSRAGVNFNGEEGVSLHLHLFVEPFIPGCGQTSGTPLTAGSTAEDLADGLAGSGFIVREGPTPVTAFGGKEGYRVAIEVPSGCEFGGDPGITHEDGPYSHLLIGPGDMIEAWSFEWNGRVVMVEALWLVSESGIAGAPGDVVADLRTVIDTLTLVP